MSFRVYDLTFFDETAKIEAHESEVLCVEFSPRESGNVLHVHSLFSLHQGNHYV